MRLEPVSPGQARQDGIGDRTGRAEILEFGSDRRKPRRVLLARGFYGSSLESDPRELASAGQAGARRESRPLAPGYFAMRSK
jgi:hypothetical protein